MDLTPETLKTLRKMVQYSQQTITPDGGKHVAFNDSDPDSVLTLARQMAALLYPYQGAEQPQVEFTFDGGTATIHTKELGKVAIECM